MPEIQNRSLSRFDTMKDEELRQILREDASKPEGEDTDMETILYIMEVLAKRRNENQEGKTPAEALESFKQNYDTNQDSSMVSEKIEKGSRKGNGLRWLGKLAAAAAVLALVIGCSLPAKAWEFSLWDIIAKWTQETFHFGSFGEDDMADVPTPDIENPCASLQEALDKYGITLNLVPTWLPDGYVENSIDVQENMIQRRVFASYQNGDNEIVIRITDYLEGDPTQVEQSDSLLEVYLSNNSEYYIFSNYEELKAVWISENCECCILGSISITEMKEIIDSIEKG